MKYRHLPAIIMLSGGALTCFICILKQYDTLYSLKALLAVLLIGCFLGTLTRHALILITSMDSGLKTEENKEKTVADTEEGSDRILSAEGLK